MKLSVKILLYHFYFKAFQAYVAINFALLKISAEIKDELVLKFGKWMDALDPYTNPETNGPITASDMNGQYNICSFFVESVRLMIKNNPLVELNALQRIILGIPKPKKPTSEPVPTEKPGITVISNADLTVKVFVFSPSAPIKKAKQKGVSQIGFKMAITDIDVEPGPKDFLMQIPETKTIFEKLFTLSDKGKKLSMIAFYMNAKNEPGPDGAVTTVIIE